jgi:hypothetical protein
MDSSFRWNDEINYFHSFSTGTKLLIIIFEN